MMAFMPNGIFYLIIRTVHFQCKGVSGYALIIPCFIEILVFNANGVDPDSAASDLGLHCFADVLFMGR